MHKLLQSQLQTHLGDLKKVPAEWGAFLQSITEAYQQADDDRMRLRQEIADTKRGQEVSRESEQRLLKQQAALVEIARGKIINESELTNMFPDLAESAGRALEVERTSIWLYDEGHTKIRCSDLYELTPNRHSSGLELPAAAFPAYFRGIEIERVIAAHDVSKNPYTKEFVEIYCKPLGISSMLDAPIRVGGRTVGVVCHEHIGPPRRWTTEDQTFVGSISDFVSLAVEISERRRAEAALQSTISDLAHSNAELEQFAYVASHDLQEPLRMMASYAQLLSRRYGGKLDKEADEFIHFMVSGSQRMQSLILDLLDYSRVTRLVKPPVPVRVKTVIEETVGNMKKSLEDSGGQVKNNVDANAVVIGNSMQLARVVQNLLGNAIKFAKPGQPPRIEVSAHRDGNYWVFAVRDEGIGMDPKFYDRVFMIFQRLHTQDEYPGTGIGLAICKKIVEQHSGRIWVESEPAKGSTFFFNIPANEEGQQAP